MDGLWTDFGPVIDISRTGLRVLSRSKLNGIVRIKVYCGKGPIELTGCVRRCRRRGFRKHDVGIEYVNLTPTLQHKITAMARAFGEGFAV